MRPSRIPSKSIEFGGSCLVASAAAWNRYEKGVSLDQKFTTYNGSSPYLQLPVVQADVFPCRGYIAVPVFTMFPTMLFTCPLCLELKDDRSMQLYFIREYVHTWDLNKINTKTLIVIFPHLRAM
jgi:hypothetical protein